MTGEAGTASERAFAATAPAAAAALAWLLGTASGPTPWLSWAVLLAGASACSAVSGRFAHDRGVRLAPAFFLAACVTLPLPASLLVAAAALASSPGGLTGTPDVRSSGAARIAAPAAAVIVPFALAELGSTAGASGGWTFVRIAAGGLVLQGIAWGIPFASRRAHADTHRALARSVGLEAVNLPVAWLLAELVSSPADGAPAALLVASGLVTLAAGALVSVERAESRLRAVHDALAERVTELATLHAIGREIVSSLDLRRVVAIVDRECRKILDVDEFSIALTAADSSELRSTYRRARGEAPRESDVALAEGLETRVARLRQSRRLDDLEEVAPTDAPVTLHGRAGSALVVPLVVENRVIGVLCVRSDMTRRYDDHHLAFLTTIGQQAAVAIENARHYRMATRDSLTGLYLRDYFFRRVEEERARAARYRTPFALLMIDLDGFKKINDEHGHPTGDRYLRAFARALREHLRAADLACRYGGDEFCVLLPETDRDGAVAIAERVRSAAAALSEGLADAPPIRISASIGIGAYPEDGGDDVSAVLRTADEALYRAKRSGRDRVVSWRPGRAAATPMQRG